MSYYDDQLLQVKPTTQDPEYTKIQIRSEYGKTNWISIRSDTLQAIEKALFDQSVNEYEGKYNE